MNLKQVQALSDKELRIKVAELCDLTLCDSPHHRVKGHTLDGMTFLDLPNYTGDLNAMHEAEKLLTAIQGSRYLELLCKCSIVPFKDFGQPTARQRSEAFVLAMEAL